MITDDEGAWVKMPWELRRLVKRRHNSVTETRSELTPEIMEWLEDNIGQRGREWSLYQSCVTNPQHMAVYFPKTRDAMMFKLAWGGM